MSLYEMIKNPETRGCCSIYERDGQNILAKYIKQYQIGGNPCSNCGKRRPRHNMRTCKAPGAKYWRKLSDKKRRGFLRNKPTNKTRGKVAMAMSAKKSTKFDKIELGESKMENGSPAYKYFFYKKSDIPSNIRILFEKSEIITEKYLTPRYKLCIGEKYELKKALVDTLKIKNIDTKNTYRFDNEGSAYSILLKENIPLSGNWYDNHYIKAGEGGSEYILYVGKWQILSRIAFKTLEKDEKITKVNETSYILMCDMLSDNDIIKYRLENLGNKNYHIIVIYEENTHDLWNMQKQLSSQSYEYMAFTIDDTIIPNKIVGYTEAYDILDKSHLDNWYGNDKNMDISSIYNDYETTKDYNIYISLVKIHPNYRNKHLCKPLVKYIISCLRAKFKNKGLFIENASGTNNGVPACFCYYKAGCELGYDMRYKLDDNSDEIQMTDEFCKNCGTTDDKVNKCQRTYYYKPPNAQP